MSDIEKEQAEDQPERSEFKGKPIIRIPTYDSAHPENTSHWMSFGKHKAQAIVKYYEIIKKFAEEQAEDTPNKS
jgi:hypothetical protein